MNLKNKHGLSKKSKLYGVWVMMKQRCYNTNNKDYYAYGARGVQVCNQWKENYNEFHNWSYDNGYKEGLSLDRIDVNGNYEPNNCRWATIEEQANNKRNTIYVDINDKFYTLSDLSAIYNIKRETLEMRYIRGDRGERLIRSVRKRAS